MQFISDLYFWHGIDRTLRSRVAQDGPGKNFFYRFDVDLSQNFVKKMHIGPDEYHKYPGASHCDELPYLFKTGPETKIVSPVLDSEEFEMINAMVQTFTTFAETGDPNNSLASGWEQVKNQETPFRCMNIHQAKIETVNWPESDRIKVWNEIFAKEQVELF